MPGASCIIIGTRFSERDLIGELLAEPGSTWRHINVPAISTAGVPDALGREPGIAMISALGRDLEGFLEIRRGVGERNWAALYLGVPSTPEGALIQRAWLDDWRLPCAPSAPVLTVVGVDPADSGSGDAAGIVAASLTRDGVIAFVADKSAPLTSDAWARAAVELAVDTGASEIAVEAFAAGATYVRVVREALARYKIDRPIRITSWPPRGSERGRGDALARSAALLQGLETGTVRLAGFLPDFEQAALTWQQGQHQPDALAALVVAHDVLIHAAGQQWSFSAPSLTARLGDGATVTSLTGFLSRRIDDGRLGPNTVMRPAQHRR
jgi:phage terminase large subunit-like protein